MFDVGFSELVLIALLALVVLGPKRLPEVARTAGRWMAKLRGFVSEVRHDLDRELRNAEIMELQKLKQDLDDTRRVMEETSGRVMQQLNVEPISEPSLGAATPKTATASKSAKKPKSPAKKTAVKNKTVSTKRPNGRARKRA